MRFILYLVLFYFLFKAALFFVRYLAKSKRRVPNNSTGEVNDSKYKNVQEADFKEIKDDNKSGS